VPGGARELRCCLGWVPSVEWAGLYLADERGELARRGLRVEALDGGPGQVGAARRVAAGEAEVGLPSDVLDVLRTVGAGADLVMVGASMRHSPLGFAWLPDTEIDELSDLVGARIGAGSDADRVVLDTLFELSDLPARYDFHLIGHGSAELETRRIDVMCCSTVSQPAAAALRGVELRTSTFAEWGLPLPADVVVVTRDMLAAERPTVRGFLAALAAGWRANEADPTAAPRLVADRHGRSRGLSYEWSVAENERQRPFVRSAPQAGLPWLGFEPADLAGTVAALVAAGMPGLPSVADCVDLTVLAESADA
jgi:ABC-type nitrate/sulfonate/bicarbonate transport system substrate-binding protein